MCNVPVSFEMESLGLFRIEVQCAMIIMNVSRRAIIVEDEWVMLRWVPRVQASTVSSHIGHIS
jgi:hypothetical protein